MAKQYDIAATRIREHLPEGPCLVVIGSASFWDGESETTCVEIGTRLAAIPALVLITGGVDGVGDTVGRWFCRARELAGAPPRVCHVLPEQYPARPYGETHFAGKDMGDRREALARLSDLYLAIEGGPGTAHEARVAIAHGADLIPVGRSGGHSGQLYAELARPDWADASAWIALGTASIHPRDLADAVKLLVIARLAETQDGP